MEINFSDPVIQIITLILVVGILAAILRFVLKIAARIVGLGCSLVFIAGLLLIFLRLFGN